MQKRKAVSDCRHSIDQNAAVKRAAQFQDTRSYV